MASSGSSRSSSDEVRHGDGDSSSSSPIPYRERPLEYMLATCCYCGSKAVRWISWSDANPGRRYLTCLRARAGGCHFWKWHDLETSPFLKDVLLDLRDTVRALRKENRALIEGFNC